MEGIKESARRYTDYGFHLVAIKEGQKGPTTKNWHTKGIDPNTLNGNENLGIIHNLNGTCSVDIDHALLGAKLFRFLGLKPQEMKKKYPCYRGKKDGLKILFRMPQNLNHVGIKKLTIKEDGEVITIFELRGSTTGTGVTDVLPPSLHPQGHRYEWVNPLPSQFSDIPELPPRLVEVWKNWDVEEKAMLNFLGHFKPEPITRKLEPKVDSLDIITKFNSTYSVEEILTRNGYDKKGENRFLSPYSSTKTPGLVLLEDGTIYSHHASDTKLADGHSHDAFDVQRILEANGDWKRAFNNARSDLGIQPIDYIEPMDDRAFKFFHASEAVDRVKTPEWVIKGVFEKDSLVGMFGAPKSGKSFVTIDMACAVANGRDWHEKRTKKGVVLYIAGEGNAALARRLLAWEKLNNANLKDSNLYYSDRGVQMLDALDAQMMRDEALSIQDMYEEEVSMVVIDTLARNFGPGNENSTEDMNKFVSSVDRHIREQFNCAVLLVHHSGYGSNVRGRGSSVLPAALDTEYKVTRHGEDNDWYLNLEQTLVKDGRPLAPMSFAFKEVEFNHLLDEDGNPTTSGALETKLYEKELNLELNDTQEALMADFMAVYRRKVEDAITNREDVSQVSVSQEELRIRVDGRLNANQLNKQKDQLINKKQIVDRGNKEYQPNEEMRTEF